MDPDPPPLPEPPPIRLLVGAILVGLLAGFALFLIAVAAFW